ncbi:GreA/GreB family elongation factor [Fluviicola taffensis]|uniref:GreA/GreB family elongation factor n=1 Tax=Fluviicola taffensis (strain DSM 16823 / NCIMB 13979 / RW262) TaxID=755732 RepID=F2IAJ0_FLUTR|nr:GreA/GreB family elongation factor [Fluviicola taffensis]AEA43126.1 GreA/GreB family elongation factor [Fluviicola taffensis DSM 16823]
MKYPRIILDKKEYELIKALIHPISESTSLMNSCISRLREELKTAELFTNGADFPQDVIRLNSIVDVNTPFGIMKIQLVLPENSNSEQKRISILTPMGSALIGYAEKDKIMWEFPNGTHEVEILKVSHSQF